MADDGGFNAAFVLLDRKSTTDILGPQEVELWRGRLRTRALEADPQRGDADPVEASMPPDANWNAAHDGVSRAATWRRPPDRFELVADASPDQASSWTLSAGSFWAARAQPAGRQSAEVRALSQARSAARPAPSMGSSPRTALGMQIKRRLRGAGARPAQVATCCATTAPPGARWRCCNSAPRRRRSANCSPRRSTTIREYVEAVMALALKAQPPALAVSGRQCQLGSAPQHQGL